MNVLDLWQAKSEKPSPVLLFIHGGGFRQGSKIVAGGHFDSDWKTTLPPQP